MEGQGGRRATSHLFEVIENVFNDQEESSDDDVDMHHVNEDRAPQPIT